MKRRQLTLHHTGRNDLSGGKSGHVLQGFVFGSLILRKTQEKLIRSTVSLGKKSTIWNKTWIERNFRTFLISQMNFFNGILKIIINLNNISYG